MSNDPSFILAKRARDLYVVSPRATFNELLAICRERRILVIIQLRLEREGWYGKSPDPDCPYPVILLRRRRRWVLAHELFHAWISENIEHGIVYPFSDYADDDVEAAADRFACLMCGSFGEQMQAVLGFGG